MTTRPHKLSHTIILIALLLVAIPAFAWFIKEKHMHDNKVVEWGAELSIARLTIYKKDNFSNQMSIQKSDKVADYSTSFYLSDGTWLRSLDGSGGFWGYGEKPLGGNEFEQPLPDKVRITYLDSITNQYYQTEQRLPTDKIYELMTNTDKKIEDANQLMEIGDGLEPNYQDIELAFAPHGWIIVFVTGWAGRKEVASFQATAIEPDPKTLEGDPVSSGDESLYIDYEFYLKNKDINHNEHFQNLRHKSPEAYQKWLTGEWRISSDWYKRMQTKFPWKLSIVIDGQEWNGEYYAEFANTERFALLDDQLDKNHSTLKAVPIKITTWATDNTTGDRTELEVHLFPRPKWAARGTNSASYIPYYQDPNLNRFFQHFADLYPKRSLATNDQYADTTEFATLTLHFNKELILQEAYLQKDKKTITLDGAYQFSRAPVDMDYNPYIGKRDYPRFLTEPKAKDLSDPDFVDVE